MLELKPTQHFHRAAAGFNEASLVKTLERKASAGPALTPRSSAKIQERGYVEVKDRRFYATPIGMK